VFSTNDDVFILGGRDFTPEPIASRRYPFQSLPGDITNWWQRRDFRTHPEREVFGQMLKLDTLRERC
jgi:hypothetical protein